jgi:predicted MFS family arabinose efflux permease
MSSVQPIASDDADLNSFRGIASAILLGVIGPEVFIVQPGFVQGLVQKIGFTEQGAGYTASVEMFGIAATTVALTFLANRIDWRKLLYVSLLVMFATNAASAYVHDLNTFAIVRFFAGLASGTLITISFTAIGLTRKVDRNFGLLIMWVLLYGAFGLLVMPAAFEAVGMSGVLWFFALFPLLGIPAVRHLPRSGTTVTEIRDDAVELSVPLKSSALLSIFTYFLAQGVVWAYLFLIGVNAGLTEQQVANGLMISQFAGVGGAFLAAWLAHRTRHALGLTIGIIGGAIVLYPLVGHFGALVYAVTVSIYNFAWNFVQPVMLGAMARFDRKGLIVTYAVAAQMCGLAFGPGLAASVIGEGKLSPVIWLGLVLFVLSLALILPPVWAQARRSSSQPIPVNP